MRERTRFPFILIRYKNNNIQLVPYKLNQKETWHINYQVFKESCQLNQEGRLSISVLARIKAAIPFKSLTTTGSLI